ncbi:putative quinol monooxygenase [Aurantibacter sp.]|uniref:putative quinol monooxygenase n=1 Tax=Aurantibacter sp. TaxID=2807103 RepID=UPI003264318C
MKNQLTITASITATEGKREEVKQALLKLIPPTLAEEGCLNYDLHEDLENPNRFFFYENWQTKEHWHNHNESAHIAAHRNATKGLVAEVIISQLSHVKI